MKLVITNLFYFVLHDIDTIFNKTETTNLLLTSECKNSSVLANNMHMANAAFDKLYECDDINQAYSKLTEIVLSCCDRFSTSRNKKGKA